MRKRDHPVDDVRRFLEPGPIVLVTSAWKGKTNIMTMGWHMVLSEEPSLVGCFIWDRNHSFEMIRKSRECVINVPTVDLATTVVKIGNTSGALVDKFARFGLTAVPGRKVKAPLIDECRALARAIEAFHMEGIRFRMFNVDRWMSRSNVTVPPTARELFGQARESLEAAGFHTRSHQAPG